MLPVGILQARSGGDARGEIECVLDARSILGEGPLWDVQEQALYWVDIERREIDGFDPASGQDRQWSTPEDVGSLAVREQGGLVVAMTSGFHFFDPVTGRFEAIADPEADRPENRFNDGKPDRRGRFWVGTMHDPETTASGALYRLDPDLSWHRMVQGVTVSNGLAWRPSRTPGFAQTVVSTCDLRLAEMLAKMYAETRGRSRRVGARRPSC